MTDKIILPIELYNKILTYNIHPVAELIKKIHPTAKIIRPFIKKHKEVNRDFAEFYPEFEQEFSSFSAYYMYYSRDNPYTIRNNESYEIFQILGFTY